MARDASRVLRRASRREQDDEVGVVGVADEMLGAIDDEVPALLDRSRADGTQVGTGTRLGHRETVDPLAAYGRQQVALALLALAREQDIGWATHAIVVQRVAGAPQFLFVQRPRDRIEPTAADVDRHVGCVQAGCDRLRLEFALQFVAQDARALDLRFVRVQLPLHERARRIDDQPLFVGETEVHGCCRCLAWLGGRSVRSSSRRAGRVSGRGLKCSPALAGAGGRVRSASPGGRRRRPSAAASATAGPAAPPAARRASRLGSLRHSPSIR